MAALAIFMEETERWQARQSLQFFVMALVGLVAPLAYFGLRVSDARLLAQSHRMASLGFVLSLASGVFALLFGVAVLIGHQYVASANPSDPNKTLARGVEHYLEQRPDRPLDDETTTHLRGVAALADDYQELARGHLDLLLWSSWFLLVSSALSFGSAYSHWRSGPIDR